MQSIDLRHLLHQAPELSGHEEETEKRIAEFFEPLQPDQSLTNLGGTGLAFSFGSPASGKTILLRCELDGLPIHETNKMPHRSKIDGVSHKCGHDGHMAILAEVGKALSKKRPTNGRVVLLFQPAEESGAGAAAVISDPMFHTIQPDFAFSLHNLPGFPIGEIVLRYGTFACASRGMVIRLKGRSAHAAQPETGLSPSKAMCHIICGLENAANRLRVDEHVVLVTVVGVGLGGKSFGIAPGIAHIYATLRGEADDDILKLVQHCEKIVATSVAGKKLKADICYEEIFPATVNSDSAVDSIRKVCADMSVTMVTRPFRWSEDFGRFTRIAEGAFSGSAQV